MLFALEIPHPLVYIEFIRCTIASLIIESSFTIYSRIGSVKVKVAARFNLRTYLVCTIRACVVSRCLYTLQYSYDTVGSLQNTIN